MRIPLKSLAGALGAALLALLLSATPAYAQQRTLVASLDGGDSGDADGSGVIWIELNQGQGEICYELAIQGTGPVSNLRIYELATGKSIVLLLNGVGTTSDCVTVDKALVRQIRRNSAAYGVVVGTSQYPQNALSGALTPPTGNAAGVDDVAALLPGAAGLIDLDRVDWAVVDWSSVDWSRIDWANTDWKKIEWGDVDWGSLDLSALGLPPGIDLSALELPKGFDLRDYPLPDWPVMHGDSNNGNWNDNQNDWNDDWNDEGGDGNNGRGNEGNDDNGNDNNGNDNNGNGRGNDD